MAIDADSLPDDYDDSDPRVHAFLRAAALAMDALHPDLEEPLRYTSGDMIAEMRRRSRRRRRRRLAVSLALLTILAVAYASYVALNVNVVPGDTIPPETVQSGFQWRADRE